MYFQIAAGGILVFFYVIYFAKMLLQRKKGIQTRQIGRRKEVQIRRVERLMSIATCSVVPAQLASIALSWSWLPDSARFTGCLLGGLGDLIFLLAVVAMRDSWRAGIPDKNRTELIEGGVYAFSRNPAFLGFDFMYLGVCLTFCNPLTIALSLFAMVMLHLQILQEERYLTEAFGAPYLSYKGRVFRYLGRR